MKQITETMGLEIVKFSTHTLVKQNSEVVFFRQNFFQVGNNEASARYAGFKELSKGQKLFLKKELNFPDFRVSKLCIKF